MANSYNMNQKILTRSSIEEALVLLMMKKPFQEISVSSVCSRAGVSRMAFYRHFSDLQEVLRCYLADQQDEFLSGLTEQQKSDNLVIGSLFLGRIERNRRFFKAVFDGNLHWILLDYIISGMRLFNESFGSIPGESGEAQDYRLSFYAGGFICMIARWISRDCGDPKEKLMSLFMDQEGFPVF